MKKGILIIYCVFIALFSFAQDDSTEVEKYWTKGIGLTINFNQSSFTNWATGGENVIAVTGLTHIFSNYKKTKSSWDNSLDLAYGMLQSGTSSLRKNEDKIDFSSMYGRYFFSRHWWYSALLNFKSQFADGYDYPNDTVIVSHFLAPGYLLCALGLNYKSSDNNASLFLSPLTSKITFMNDQRLADKGAFGVTPAKYDTVNGAYHLIKHGEQLLNQFGAYLKFSFKKDVFKNVNFATKLELFSNYIKDPQNIVVNWENILAMKVNKYLSASISTLLIYDDNVPVPVKELYNGITVYRSGPRLQFKEVLAIGLSCNF